MIKAQPLFSLFNSLTCCIKIFKYNCARRIQAYSKGIRYETANNMQNEYTYEHTPKVPEVTKLFQIHGV